MAQYHFLVNFDKKEYLDSRQLGIGRRLIEQLESFPSTPQAAFILLIASNARGGGDLFEVREVERYLETKIAGRWAGDRIAVIGDAIVDGDININLEHSLSQAYDRCVNGEYREISSLINRVFRVLFD